MTSEQFRLYTNILHLFRTYGKGGATWTRTRASGGTSSADPTLTQTTGMTIRFCQNNRVAQAQSLPAIPIFTADWWGVAAAGADIQAQDVYDNGSIAFLITGTPDTSQDFLAIPAALTQLPLAGAIVGSGFRAGLRIGAW